MENIYNWLHSSVRVEDKWMFREDIQGVQYRGQYGEGSHPEEKGGYAELSQWMSKRNDTRDSGRASRGAQKALLSLEQSVAEEAPLNKIREAQRPTLKWKA